MKENKRDDDYQRRALGFRGANLARLEAVSDMTPNLEEVYTESPCEAKRPDGVRRCSTMSGEAVGQLTRLLGGKDEVLTVTHIYSVAGALPAVSAVPYGLALQDNARPVQ